MYDTMSTFGFQPGDEISAKELMAFNEAIRKSTYAGYQTPAVTTGGDNGPMSPGIPQSIDAQIVPLSYGKEQLVFFLELVQKDVTQMVHEAARLKRYGRRLPSFVGEGLTNSVNVVEMDRVSFKVRFMNVMREVSNALAAIRLLAPNASAIAADNDAATLELLYDAEKAVLFGDNAIDPLSFDGVITQIERMETFEGQKNFSSLNGATPDPDIFRAILTKLYMPPFYGYTKCIYVAPDVHAKFHEIATAYQRGSNLLTGAPIFFGAAGEILISYPGGAPVRVKAVPFLSNAEDTCDGTGTAFGTTVAQPTWNVPPASVVLGGGETSGWAAANAGDYKYYVIGQTSGGLSQDSALSDAVTVVKNQKVTMTINSTNGCVYKVYRSAKGVFTGQFQYAGSVRATGPTVVFTDFNRSFLSATQNSIRPGTTKVLFSTLDPEHYYFGKLLDLFRMELPSLNVTRRFSTNLWGMPVVKAPMKLWVLQDVGGVTLPSGSV